MFTRRRFFLKSALAAGAASIGFPRIGKSASALSEAPGQKPSRIIHMVADGMSLGTLTGADYLSLQLRKRGLAWTNLIHDARVSQGFMNMRSLDSMVTDSSAASSSWGSGSRVPNGVLNRLPSDRKLTTLYELFADKGWKRGLVTTTEITHATPAGFAVSTSSRNAGPAIAQMYLERKVDVLLGGGEHHFDSKHRQDGRDLKAAYATAGYNVMRTADDLAAAPSDKRWLGVFHGGHLPFTLDHVADAALQKRVPTLAVMTRRALDWLGRHEHFILQVEGGRVDHAAHNCDAAAALRDMIAFDEALEAVLEFQKERPDTLVVVTTDHGNGNMGVNGTGNAYRESSPKFKNVANVKASFVEIIRQLHGSPVGDEDEDNLPKGAEANQVRIPSIKEIQAVLLATAGYAISDRRAGVFQRHLANKGEAVYALMESDVVQLGQLLANHLAIGWTGNAHTADYVPVTATGPGAERFRGFLQGVDVFRHYTQLAGIDFKNPEDPLLADLEPDSRNAERMAEYVMG